MEASVYSHFRPESEHIYKEGGDTMEAELIKKIVSVLLEEGYISLAEEIRFNNLFK